MSHPLEQQIARLRRKVGLLVWLHGLSWLVAATLAAFLAMGLLDYLCHFSLPLRKVFADTGIRVICSLVVAGVAVWMAYRYVLRGARARFADVALASRVEGRFPDLHDRLTSAVEFLRENEGDPQAGSPELRRAVIAQTTAAVEHLPLSQAVNYRPATRAGITAGAVIALATIAVLLNPAAAGTALARLVNPFGGPDWPQETHLEFQDQITRTATGKPLELVVVDRDRDNGVSLPREVRLFVRFDGESAEQAFPMRLVDGTMVHRFASVTRPFSYWAEGGDDLTMRQRPTHLEVIEPPAVQTLALELFPPAYTGWPAVKSEKQIRALEGTRVAFEGTSNKPLRSATLCVSEEGKDAKAVREAPAEVTTDGFGFQLRADGEHPFVVSGSGQYWFRLEDAGGIVGDDAPYGIRAVADVPPTASIDEPRQEKEYTAVATLPLRISAKDDLALAAVVLHAEQAMRGDKTPRAQREIVIAAAPDKPQPQPLGLATDKLGEARQIVHRLSLREAFGELAAGTQVTLEVLAHDFKPQTGRGTKLTITIITPDDVRARVSERQTDILKRLYDLLVIQRTARKELGSVEARFEKIRRLGKVDLDGLERSKLSQDLVTTGLTHDTHGLAVAIERLLAHLRDNGVDSTDIARRMEGLLADIRRLQKNQLPAIAGELRDAGKAAQSKLDSDATREKLVGDNLTAGGKHQDEVIATLEAVLGNLTEWDNFRRFSRDLAGLLREHESIVAETAKIAPDTLTKDFKDLTPQQQGELSKLGRRQQEVAREFDAIGQRMENMRGKLADKSPGDAGVLEDALKHARSQGLSNHLRQAAGNLEQNQLGQAGQRQQQATANLREMLNILDNSKQAALSRLVKNLREAEQQLKDLTNRQKGLLKKMQAAAANPDEAQRRRELQKLVEEQRQLQKETDALARKLKRLEQEKANQAGGHASSAAGQMSKSGDQSQQGNSDEAQKNAEQALKDLNQAEQELNEARREAELDLAMEQLAKISHELEGLKKRQQACLNDTLRLDPFAVKNALSDGQKESIRDLAQHEELIRQQALALAEKLAEAAVFQAALKGAARDLETAIEQLQQLKTGAATQTAERNALRRFEQLLEAIKPEPPDPNKKKSDGGKGGGNKQQPIPRDGIPGIAQLKLLKMMQLELNARTADLDGRLADRKPESFTELERRERQQLSEEQTEVARLALNLSKPPDPGPEDAAEMLPDGAPDALPNDLDKKLDSKEAGTKNLGGDKQGEKSSATKVKDQGTEKSPTKSEESDPPPPAKPPQPQ